MKLCVFAKSTLAHRTGGMEVQGHLLTEALARLGHQVTVITTRHPDGLEGDVHANGVRIRFLPDAPPGVYSRRWWNASAVAFERLCREDDVDAVVSQSAAAFGVLDRLSGRPLVVNVYGSTPAGTFASEWRNASSFKKAVHLSFVGVPEYLLNTRRWWRALLPAAQAVNVDSIEGRAALIRQFRLPAERVHVLLNGLELDAYRPKPVVREAVRTRLGADADDRVVLMVGIANRQKGLDIGLRAFAAARSSAPAKLWVVGEGPSLGDLRRLAERLGVGREVTFLGHVPFGEIAQYFLSADVFLNPTRRNEGLQVVAVSAMAAGNAVISSDAGGIRSAITHGVNGLLVRRGDLGGFTATLGRVLSDPPLARRLAVEARRTAEKTFDINRLAQRFLEVAAPLVGKGKRGVMRICCLTVQTGAHVVGGMAQQTLHTAKELTRLRHEVTVLTTRHPRGDEFAEDDGVRVYYLRGTVPGSQRGGWWRESRKEFWRLHRTLPFDIVWSQSIGGSAVARQLRRDHPPRLVPVIQGTNVQMIVSLLNAFLRSREGWREWKRTARRILGYLVSYGYADTPVYRNASAVIPVSEAVASSIRRWYGVPADRLHVVHNAVDTDLFAPNPDRGLLVRKRYGLDGSHTVLLTLGVLSRQKGVDLAIEALARLLPRFPQLRLLVVGSGEYEGGLRRLARKLGVEAAVHFIGSVPHEQTAEFYNAADLFLLPTLREEGFANVILEAMASERAVIASRIGGNPEAVLEGETGFLIPPGDIAALVDRIAYCLEHPEVLRSFGARGRALVRERWNQTGHAARMEAIFKQVTGQVD